MQIESKLSFNLASTNFSALETIVSDIRVNLAKRHVREMPTKLPIRPTNKSSKNFGLLFVCEAQYEHIKNNTKQNAEDYCYAYQINGDMTDDDLKELIKGFDFNYEDVTDKYYLETIREATEKRDEIQKAIDDLCEGASNLNDGIKQLNDGLSDYKFATTLMLGAEHTLTTSAHSLYDGMEEGSRGACCSAFLL